MTITYPLTPPGQSFVRVTLVQKNIVASTRSPFTGSQQVQQFSGQWWELTMTLPPMKRATAEAWRAFLASLKGMYGTFYMGDPTARQPRGIATGSPVVYGASQTGSQLITSGWTANKTGILLAGDYLQVGSGSSARLHQVLTDANSDGSGHSTLDIWPDLRSSPADASPVVVNSPVTTFRLATNDVSIDVDQLHLYGISIPAVEAI